MINTNLELNINTLKQYTIKMMERCENAVEKSVESLMKKDLNIAKTVIEEDDEIDTLREYIRDRSIELIALKQPMAKDLRYIYALGSIALELERIGDYAVNISSALLEIGDEPYIKDLVDIPKMGEGCINMIREAKKALLDDNEKLAYEVALKDDSIDKLYAMIHEDSLEVMNNKKNTINQGVRLLCIGRCLERIGDHTTNVCEMIIYAINGNMVEIG